MHIPDECAGDNTETSQQPTPVTLDNQPHHESNIGPIIDTACESLLGLVAQDHPTTPGSSALPWSFGPVDLLINDLMRADLCVCVLSTMVQVLYVS